jgi:NarL family two-component system response regulator LiaR
MREASYQRKEARMRISVIVVDREEIIRRGTAELLRSNPDFHVVGEAPGAAEAIEISRACQPDVVLLRVYSLADEGIETLTQLKTGIPSSAGIVVLASSGDGGSVIAAVETGARGFLTTGMDASSLMSAIRTVARGEVAFSRAAILHIIDHLSLPGQAPPRGLPATALTKPVLTRREVEVLRLVMDGPSNREIAESLVISEHTVRAHLRNILDKLRLENRIQAATWATRMGLGTNGVRAAQV